MTKAYYRGAMGIFIVYDITDRKSFERIDTWMQHIANHASNDVHKVILGNKVDMSESARVPQHTYHGAYGAVHYRW